MYIETDSKKYPCADAPSLEGDTLRFVLPEGGPLELGDTMRLYMDDGFEMKVLDVSGYLRWELAGNMLTITNLPVPEPQPEPAEPVMSTEDALVAEVVDLRYQVEMLKLGGNQV